MIILMAIVIIPSSLFFFSSVSFFALRAQTRGLLESSFSHSEAALASFLQAWAEGCVASLFQGRIDTYSRPPVRDLTTSFEDGRVVCAVLAHLVATTGGAAQRQPPHGPDASGSRRPGSGGAGAGASLGARKMKHPFVGKKGSSALSGSYRPSTNAATNFRNVGMDAQKVRRIFSCERSESLPILPWYSDYLFFSPAAFSSLCPVHFPFTFFILFSLSFFLSPFPSFADPFFRTHGLPSNQKQNHTAC